MDEETTDCEECSHYDVADRECLLRRTVDSGDCTEWACGKFRCEACVHWCESGHHCERHDLSDATFPTSECESFEPDAPEEPRDIPDADMTVADAVAERHAELSPEPVQDPDPYPDAKGYCRACSCCIDGVCFVKKHEVAEWDYCDDFETNECDACFAWDRQRGRCMFGRTRDERSEDCNAWEWEGEARHPCLTCMSHSEDADGLWHCAAGEDLRTVDAWTCRRRVGGKDDGNYYPRPPAFRWDEEGNRWYVDDDYEPPAETV
jgi:hypothetical protein